jgi:DNA-binding MarR family transcriptional regulator
VTDDIQWLNDVEQHMWRQWLALNAEMMATLQRDMLAGSGLSNSDYQVLVVLVETAEGRMRVTDLAKVLQWERSRVSHHVARMEKRGLVSRLACEDDGRGADVSVTAAGRAAVEQAAPGHVRTVRKLVFDALTADEVAQLGEIFERLRSRSSAR